MYLSVADPGFPRGGAPTPRGEGINILFDQFSPKLRENEKKIGPEGDTFIAPPLDAPLFMPVCIWGNGNHSV